MKLFIMSFSWIVLFCCSYFILSYRKKLRNDRYQYADIDPTLPISIIVPLFGIVWGGMEIMLYKAEIIGEWERR